jgi:type IV secretion system protein VirD4
MAASIGRPSGFSFGFYYFEKTETVNDKRELFYEGERHILLIGASRVGKSTRLLLQNLARILHRSIVVLDIKGELCAQTRRIRRKLCGAANVKTVNPYNLHDLGSDGFNPLAVLNPNDDLFYDKAKRLTLAIIESDGEKDAHWSESAMGLLTAGIMWECIQARIEARPASLLKVRQLICERDEFEEVPPIKQGRTLVPQPPRQVKGLKINCERMAREGGDQIAGLISRFLRDHGKNELSGIQSTFDTQTQFLLSIPIARDLAKGDWSFSQLRDTPTTVYIILPPDEIKDKRRWTRLLITSALCEHLRPGPVSTLFILDEFRVSVGQLEIINTFWSLVAGYGVTFLAVVQSVLHLKALFKEEWEIFAGQSGAVACLGAVADLTSARWLSERAGRRTEFKTSQNEGQGVTVQGISTSTGETISESETSFKTPEELMSMQVGTGRIWVPGKGNTSIPFFAPNYWKLTTVRDLIDPNPYVAANAPEPSSSPGRARSSTRRRAALLGALVALVIGGGVVLHQMTGKAQSSASMPTMHQPATRQPPASHQRR